MADRPEPREELVLRGIAGSSGVAHGPAFVFLQSELDIPAYEVGADQSASEIARLEAGLLQTRQQISKIRHEIAAKLGEAEAQIFDAHQLVLEDKALIDEVIHEQKTTQFNIEYCFHQVALRYIEFFDSMDDEYLKERVADIRDVARRLLQNLLGQQEHGILKLSEGKIMVAQELSPSETVGMDRDKLLGFITESGGSTSHAVIMARSLQIPAVVGVHGATEEIDTQDHLLIDGYDGLVYINPSEQTLFRYGKIERRRKSLRDRYYTSVGKPSETPDKRSIVLRANIDGVHDLEWVKQVKAKGVGLFRTETLFLRENDFPDEEVQFKEYKGVVESLAPDEVVIRTLDLGGDKILKGRFEMDEGNPFMGFRAIRFCLQHPEIFKDQLRAILRASVFGNVRVMYPMISGRAELEQADALLEEAKEELRERGQDFDDTIQTGSMIEIPSAAMVSDMLAEHCGFFSIGTNDLIQYMLAADRMNDRIAHLFDASHPAVLRAIQGVIDSGKRRGIPVSICGEMASDPRYTAILLGMGADELSVAAPSLPEINFLVRMIEQKAATALAEEALRMDDPLAITELLSSYHKALLAELE